MEKRYQVFVSSTYEDLKEERQMVIECLLNMHCIPAGMEFFPATNEEQWSHIQRVIDDCDYYLLILAGKYGSIGADGMGYTEKEFRYAMSKKKPIVSFLHKDIVKLAGAKIEMDQVRRERLTEFIALAKDGRLVRFWESKEELGMRVLESLHSLPEDFPAPGWVKGDQVANEETLRELLRLSKENETLRKELLGLKARAPEGTEELAQGDDTVDLIFFYQVDVDPYDVDGNSPWDTSILYFEWTEILQCVGPRLMGGCDEAKMKGALEQLAHKRINAERIDIRNEDFQTVKVQLKALGLIQKGPGVGNWELTDYGETELIQSAALRRKTTLDQEKEPVLV